MRYPAREECYELFKKFHVPERVIRHCEQVNKVANLLAERLAKAGFDIDRELIDRASLLHDLFRVCDFVGLKKFFAGKAEQPEWMTDDAISIYSRLYKEYSEINHPNIFYEEYKDIYPELAVIISSHGESPRFPSIIWEQRILRYADCRVMHDKIVSVKERLLDFLSRYGGKPEIDAEKLMTSIWEIENEIFSKLNITPDDVTELLKDG